MWILTVGGSLFYANALIRKGERWFVKEDLNNSGGYEYYCPVMHVELESRYHQVEKIVDANGYLFDRKPLGHCCNSYG